MKPFSIDETHIRNSNYSQLQGKYLEPDDAVASVSFFFIGIIY